MNKLLIIIILLLTGCANYGSVELGIGPAYIMNVPSGMTNHNQIHASLVHRYHWNDRFIQETGCFHDSNGFGMGGHPNNSFEECSSQLKVKLGAKP